MKENLAINNFNTDRFCAFGDICESSGLFSSESPFDSRKIRQWHFIRPFTSRVAFCPEVIFLCGILSGGILSVTFFLWHFVQWHYVRGSGGQGRLSPPWRLHALVVSMARLLTVFSCCMSSIQTLIALLNRTSYPSRDNVICYCYIMFNF